MTDKKKNSFLEKSLEHNVPYLMTIVAEWLMKQTDKLQEELITLSKIECEHVFKKVLLKPK